MVTAQEQRIKARWIANTVKEWRAYVKQDARFTGWKVGIRRRWGIVWIHIELPDTSSHEIELYYATTYIAATLSVWKPQPPVINSSSPFVDAKWKWERTRSADRKQISLGMNSGCDYRENFQNVRHYSQQPLTQTPQFYADLFWHMQPQLSDEIDRYLTILNTSLQQPTPSITFVGRLL